MNDKMIEEMAKDLEMIEKEAFSKIAKETQLYVKENHRYNAKEDYSLAHTKTIYELVAEALYNEGYRNCKDKVVLSKEEYEKLQNKLERYSKEREFVGKCLTDATLRCVELTNDFNDMLDSIYNLAREKTAKEIFEAVKSKCKELENKYSHLCKSKKECLMETCRYEGVLAVKRELYKIAKQFGVVEE